MTTTEWVGGRAAAPLFVEEKGGFQADVIVWMDATRDLVVGMTVVHPEDPDSKVADSLRQALAKPMAGPRRPPDRVRVAEGRLAELVSPVLGGVPVEVAPTPEVEHFVQVMGESMPGASPLLAEFRKILRAEGSLVRQLLAAAARLFRATPWNELWDSEVVRLDVPELDVTRWCLSVMGRAKQSWGMVLFRSVADYELLRDLSLGRQGGPPVDFDLGVEALSLSFSAVGELPMLLRREFTELGWDLVGLDVYPIWFHTLPGRETRNVSERELRILLAACAGVAEHVELHRHELATDQVPHRTEQYAVEACGNVLNVRITSPHPEVPWEREPPRTQPSSKAGQKRPTRKR